VTPATFEPPLADVVARPERLATACPRRYCLPMKTRDAWAIGDRITAGVHFPGGHGSTWSNLSDDAPDSVWASELLSRMTIMVGTEHLEYVSGYVQEVETVSGEIVMLTTTRIIRVSFTADPAPDYRRTLDATIVATRRSTIESVSLDSVSPWGDDGEAEWPRAVSAVVTTADGKTFRLPLVKRRPSFDEPDTADLLARLMS